MSNRDRLIDILQRYTLLSDTLVEGIADTLLANGVICPPCKVGDWVYVVSQGQGFNCLWNVYEGKVTNVNLNSQNKLSVRVENGEKFFGYYEPKFIFLNREDAEAALNPENDIDLLTNLNDRM